MQARTQSSEGSTGAETEQEAQIVLLLPRERLVEESASM